MDKHEIKDLKNALKAGDMRLFQKYYKEYQNDFLKFGHKYCQDEQMILDTYHDVFLVFYENIVSEKLTTLTSTLKTYLFSIGKYTLFNKLKLEKKVEAFENYDKMDDADMMLDDAEELENRKQALAKGLETLGNKCKAILQLFYYQQSTIAEIMNQLGYKNENTVKAHKSRCMKSLRNYFSQH